MKYGSTKLKRWPKKEEHRLSWGTFQQSDFFCGILSLHVQLICRDTFGRFPSQWNMKCDWAKLFWLLIFIVFNYNSAQLDQPPIIHMQINICNIKLDSEYLFTGTYHVKFLLWIDTIGCHFVSALITTIIRRLKHLEPMLREGSRLYQFHSHLSFLISSTFYRVLSNRWQTFPPSFRKAPSSSNL